MRKPLGDGAELGEDRDAHRGAARAILRGDDGVELQDAEAVRPALRETVGDQGLSPRCRPRAVRSTA